MQPTCPRLQKMTEYAKLNLSCVRDEARMTAYDRIIVLLGCTMFVTNTSTEDILVFVYDVGDIQYFAALRKPTSHLGVLANDELLIPAGKSGRLVHKGNAQWLVGIKRGTLTGRFEPFLAPLDGQTHDAASLLELTAQGQLLWLNAPRIDIPTKRLTEAELNHPLPPAPGHVVGVGRANITDPAVLDSASALPMQGWAALPSQLTTGIETDVGGNTIWQQARAFLIGDPASATRVVFVVADIWSCSIAIKQEVVRRLSYGSAESPYQMDNIWIAGTHTHSAPAGYLHHFLYNATAFGFDPHVFEAIVSGIVAAVEAAHVSLAPGRVWVTRGLLDGITRNRSLQAYAGNPAIERAAFPNDVDEMMTHLVLEHEDPPGSGNHRPIGALNWFGIHPTNMGEMSTVVSGDNKGLAARLMEEERGKGFVAAFANGCAGDVSGNFEIGVPGFTPANGPDFANQNRRMVRAAEAQKNLAQSLTKAGGTTLTGPIQTMEHRLHMTQRTGAPAALGLSMAAGSSEDGGDKPVPEGLTLLDITDPSRTSAGLMTVGALGAAILAPVNRLLAAVTGLLSGSALGAIRGALTTLPVTDTLMLAAHFPKPILLAPGLMQPDPWTPEVLPLQLVRIGTFAVLGVPAEVTTVAGLRLRQAMQGDLSPLGVEIITVGTYTNGYAQYVTTPEEYDSQQYEGASTLFGRGTCPELEKGATELAAALSGRRALTPDAPLSDLRGRVLTKRRMSFRNQTRRKLTIRLCHPGDTSRFAPIWPGAEFILADRAERAVFIPFPWSLVLESVQVLVFSPSSGPRRARRLFPTTSDLVLVQPNGTLARSPYFPTDRVL